MAIGITGRVVRRTTKEPLQGITVDAIDKATGLSGGSGTTDTQGYFDISGLSSATYFPKALVSGDDWDIMPNIAKIYTDSIVSAGNGNSTFSRTLSGSGTWIGGVLVDNTAASGASGTANVIQARAVDIPAATTLTGTNHLVLNAGSQGSGAISNVKGVVVDTMNGSTSNAGVEISGTFGGSANNYGIKILNPSSGANNYAIKSTATAQSEFAGSIKSSHATGGIGYATGAGGTVTQLTSKSTGVTLNTISGQITMHNAALAGGALASFVLTNSAYTTSDTVIAHVSTGGSASSYRAGVLNTGSGAIRLYLENITGGSLSEAVVINFAIIKGATS